MTPNSDRHQPYGDRRHAGAVLAAQLEHFKGRRDWLWVEHGDHLIAALDRQVRRRDRSRPGPSTTISASPLRSTCPGSDMSRT